MDGQNPTNKKIILMAVLLTFLLFLILIDGFYIFQQKISQPLASPIKLEENKTNYMNIVKKSSQKKEVIGFFSSWMVEKQAKVDLNKLTQIIYFGLGVNEKGDIMRYDKDNKPLLEWTYFTSDYFNNIRRESVFTNTKILIALKNFDNEHIDNLISNQTAINNLVKQLKSLIKQYRLDGINLDFEYFTDSNFPTSQFQNIFLQNIVFELKRDFPNLIISYDVNAGVVLNDSAYDMVKIGEVVDQVVLMAYDYHQANSIHAGPVAPLNAGDNEHSVIKSLNSLVGRVPQEKIILGVPFYGYEWQTVNERYGSPVIAGSGALATIKRVDDLIKARPEAKINWDEKSASPYLIYHQSAAIKQIYFENEKSLLAKWNLVKDQKLAGIAIWTLGYEGDNSTIWKIFN